jgi:hypothetical protein
MPSVNNSIKFAKAAENRFGLKLLHRADFTNTQIANHAGTIALTFCSYPIIYNVKTVIAKLSAAQTGSMTVKINSSQTITIAAGSFFGSYDSATAFNADDIQINDYSKFEYVMFFRNQLSTEVKAAYEAGTMWEYMRNAIVVMDGRLKKYDATNTRILDASGKANHMTLTASGFTKSIKTGYVQNAATTATAYVTALSSTILAANSGTQSLFWFGKIKSLAFTPIMGNSNFAIGLTNGQTVYSRSFKPDKSYTNRTTTEKIFSSKVNSICSVKNSNALSVFINGKKTALTASETGYERDITKFALGYDLDQYADLKDITTTSAADVIYAAFFNVALNHIQIIDLELSINPNSKE